MNQALIHKRVGKVIIPACLLLFLHTSFVWAVEECMGEWEITINSDDVERHVTLSFSMNADGHLTGKWGSTDLVDIRFENPKLNFTRIMHSRVRDFEEKFVGNLKEGKITGTLSSVLGNFPVSGIRKMPKSPVLGQWAMKFNVDNREITGRLTISEKSDGALTCKWDSEFGEHVVSNVKFHDGNLTYTQKGKFAEQEWESTFEGTIKGDKLTGIYKSQLSEITVTGERVGAQLVGKWELTETHPEGTTTSRIKIDSDLTGWYEDAHGNDILIKGLKLDSDVLTFYLEWYFRDMVFRTDFKGKLDGKTLSGVIEEKTIKGDFTFDQFTKQVIGKKIEAK